MKCKMCEKNDVGTSKFQVPFRESKNENEYYLCRVLMGFGNRMLLCKECFGKVVYEMLKIAKAGPSDRSILDNLFDCAKDKESMVYALPSEFTGEVNDN